MKIPKVYTPRPKHLLCLKKAYKGERPDGSKFNGYKAIIKQTPEESLGITPNGTKFYREKKHDGSLNLFMQTKNNEEITASNKNSRISVIKSKNRTIISNTETIINTPIINADGKNVILKEINHNTKAGEKAKNLPKFVKKLFELM